MVPIELSRLGVAQRGQNALRISAKDRAVRHVGEACDRQRSRSHGVCEVIVRRRLRRDPGLAAMRMYIDGNGLAQDIERSSGGRAAAVELRGPTSPASIVSTEISAVPHIQCRGAKACL